jgi:hypothetical protein
MTVTFTVDGVPFRCIFTGAVEIARVHSGNVALRLASDGARLMVEIDQEEIERGRQLIEELKRREMGVWSAYDQVMKGTP